MPQLVKSLLETNALQQVVTKQVPLYLETTSIDRWLQHVKKWKNCQECALCTQRNKIVIARGVVPADILFVGEAPGVSEDALGMPFVGPAGQLLDAIVDSALAASKFPTATTVFTNLVLCFPRDAKQTDDHRPESEEIEACAPRLREFAEIARPRLVVCVGDTAKDWVRHLLGETGSNAWCDIIHPAAITRMHPVQRSMVEKRCFVVLRDAIELAMGVLR